MDDERLQRFMRYVRATQALTWMLSAQIEDGGTTASEYAAARDALDPHQDVPDLNVPADDRA